MFDTGVWARKCTGSRDGRQLSASSTTSAPASPKKIRFICSDVEADDSSDGDNGGPEELEELAHWTSCQVIDPIAQTAA
jgi:hypothetical protein